MAPRNDRAAREAQAWLRRYAARQELHESGVRRRRRDDVVAVVGVILVAALAVGAQLAYESGPGAPDPAPSSSTPASPDDPAPTTPDATPAPDATLVPDATPAS
ncbi:dioxygenase [Clavibacter tessellarius]|uniref:dioxygenase n=1 Tax=Clavibacter tessellarius TaxID=31965 RepID=UPI003249A72F